MMGNGNLSRVAKLLNLNIRRRLYLLKLYKRVSLLSMSKKSTFRFLQSFSSILQNIKKTLSMLSIIKENKSKI
jgi:hypothetical protein